MQSREALHDRLDTVSHQSGWQEVVHRNVMPSPLDLWRLCMFPSASCQFRFYHGVYNGIGGVLGGANHFPWP